MSVLEEVLPTLLKRHPRHLRNTTEAILKTMPLTVSLNMDLGVSSTVAHEICHGKRRAAGAKGRAGTDQRVPESLAPV